MKKKNSTALPAVPEKFERLELVLDDVDDSQLKALVNFCAEFGIEADITRNGGDSLLSSISGNDIQF